MKVRKAVRKLVALGTGAVMLGATVVGAMAAADLNDYPAPFVENGQFNGLVVVGEDAASSDVVGAIDIATSLQFASKTTTSVSVSGASGQTTLSGDAALIERGGDKLEFAENMGDVAETLTESDLQMLKSGVLSNDQGTTDYNQYLKFRVDTVTYNGSVIYSEDDRDVVGDFLYFPDNQEMFEYQLEFEEGYESDVDSNNRLDDLEDKSLVLLGTQYNIVKAERTAGTNALELTLLAGDVTDTLYEGETKTYTINGKDYEVKLLVVADTTSDVKFVINGEVTDKMQEAETDVLSDGTLIGLRDVLPNEGFEEEGGDLVEFYLGANKVVLKDDNPHDSAFDTGAAVEVNNENIEEGQLRMDVSNVTSTRVKLTNMRYKLFADGGAYDVFIPAGKGLREHLDESEGLLTTEWDIEYHGFTEPSMSEFKINPKGDDRYELEFVTEEGLAYTMPYVAIESSTNYWGDDNNRLWFTEGNLSGNGPYQIAKKDYFVVSSGLTDLTNEENTGYTHVMRYDSIDTSNNQLRFSDLAGGTKEVIYATGTLQGDLVVGGKTYTVEIASQSSDTNIRVDLDGDGTLELSSGANSTTTSNFVPDPENREARLILDGGVVVDLGNQTGTVFSVEGSGNLNGGTSAANGSLLSNTVQTNQAFVNMSVFSKEFDETGSDESIAVRVSFSTEVDVGSPIYLGPLSSFSLYTHDEDDDLSSGMTKWGLSVERRQETNNPDTLTVQIPDSQRFAQVFVTSGSTSAVSSSSAGGGAVESTSLQKINVGSAKLDSEVSDVWAQNLIVVGGPCANDAAAEVMGVTAANCGSGFTEGKAMLKMYEGRGNVALLVAGYGALDTRRAARVLADWEKYADDLTGMEVEVSGTTLTDITVSQPTAAPAPAEEAEEEAAEESSEAEE